MQKRAQTALSLFAVLALAAALTVVASGRVVARSAFQSSLLPPPDTQSPIFPTATTPPAPTATTPPATPTAMLPPVLSTPAPTGPAVSTVPAEPTLILVQPPLTPVVLAPTASAVPGFLPAPTLTNADELRRNPPAVYRPAPAPPEPTAEPTPEPVTLGRLIGEGMVALSYLWLCAGVLLLIGIAAAAIWLGRRAARRDQRHG